MPPISPGFLIRLCPERTWFTFFPSELWGPAGDLENLDARADDLGWKSITFITNICSVLTLCQALCWSLHIDELTQSFQMT